MLMPPPGVFGRRDISYHLPRAVLQCDALISVAPLRVQNGRPSLSIDAYRQLLPASKYAKAGAIESLRSPDEVAVDLFSFHPADYAIVGGTVLFSDGKRIPHNLVLAGASAPAVDAVAATILGLNAEEIPLLSLADQRGFGEPLVDLIWQRGNDIGEVKPK
jgi:hypothetical protein